MGYNPQCEGEGQRPVPGTSEVVGQTEYRGRHIVYTQGECPVCHTKRFVKVDGTMPKHRDQRSDARRRRDAAEAEAV